MKKKLSLLLTISLLLTSTAFAADDDIITLDAGTPIDWAGYGLDEDISSHKVIKLDGGQYSKSATLTTNYQIMNITDCIAVFSHPSSSAYKINANGLRACELNWTSFSGMTNSTRTGCTLYGLKPDKTSNGEAEMVAGSFLQVMKGSTQYYIPVVDMVPVELYQDGKADANVVCDDAVTYTDEAGKAPLKAYDNIASAFTIAPSTTVKTDSYIPIDIDTLNSPKTVISMTTSVYVDGDATAVISYDDAAEPILKLYGDGSVDYPNGYSYSETAFTHKANAFTSGAWHTVGITVDYASNRTLVYLDGELLTSDGWLTIVDTGTISANMKLGINTGSYTEGGVVGYDNISIDRGYYRTANHSMTETNSSTLTFSNGKITFSPSITSVATLQNNICTQTGAASVRIFTDTTMTTLADDVDSAGCAEVVSSGGVTEKVYRLVMKNPLAATVSFYEEDGQIAATATVTNARTGKTYDVIMIMVLRDADGVIQHVYASDKKTVSSSQYMQTTLVDKDNCTPEVFFISDWTAPQLMLTEIYHEN